jgi:hypothetical protein
MNLQLPSMLKDKSTRSGSPLFIPFVKALHDSATLRGPTPPSLGRASPSRTAASASCVHTRPAIRQSR